MGDSYYLKDSNEKAGFLSVPTEEYLRAIFSLAEKHGLKIKDKDILEELSSKEQTKKNRINLYIDGTNLFAGQNELFGSGKTLDFSLLIKEIKKLFFVDKIYFYASYIGKVNLKNQKLKNLVKAESQFFNQVKNTKGVYFYKGHRSPTSGKEKGVDVHLAVDIVKHVFLKECNDVIIMTGDADLSYPLEIAKELGCSTHAIFLPNRFSLAIAYVTDTATVLNFLGKFKSRKNEEVPRKLRIIAIKDNV